MYSLRIVFVFYWCLTDDHTLGGLRQNRFLNSEFPRPRSPGSAQPDPLLGGLTKPQSGCPSARTHLWSSSKFMQPRAEFSRSGLRGWSPGVSPRASGGGGLSSQRPPPSRDVQHGGPRALRAGGTIPLWPTTVLSPVTQSQARLAHPLCYTLSTKSQTQVSPPFRGMRWYTGHDSSRVPGLPQGRFTTEDTKALTRACHSPTRPRSKCKKTGGISAFPSLVPPLPLSGLLERNATDPVA